MRKFVPETLYEIKMVGGPKFSPNGEYIGFTVTTANADTNGYDSNIWIMNKNGEHHAVTFSNDAGDFIWTPENTMIFQAMREEKYKKMAADGEDISCFYELDPRGGEAKLAFTLPLRAGGLQSLGGDLYAFSARIDLNRPCVDGLDPDARRKALLDHKNPAYEVFDELPFWSNGAKAVTNKLRSVVYIYNRKTGEYKPIAPKEWNSSFQDCKNGKILYLGGPLVDFRFPQYGVFTYDIATGETVKYTEQSDYSIYFARFFGDDKIIMSACTGCNYSREDRVRFYAIDLNTKRSWLFNDYDRPIGSTAAASNLRFGGSYRFKHTDEGFLFLSIEGEATVMRLLKFDGTIEDRPLPEGIIADFDLHDGTFVFGNLKGAAPTEIYIGDKQATHFNDELMKEVYFIEAIPHKFIASDGYEIHGFCVPPAGYEPGKKYPAILDIHGGPRAVYSPVVDHEIMTWASEGYFVIFCNPRGSDGRGDEFADIFHKYFTVDYQNIMDFVDEMIKVYPDIDVDHMGVTGGSYGGVMTNWVITHTDRFKAACAQRSICNWIAFEHTSEIGPGFNLFTHEATTADDYDYLWEISPLKHADNCKTPTLFIHGDRDYMCWEVDAMSMFTALKLRGVPSKVCRFHGENHNLSRSSGRPRNRISRLHEITDWMNKYVK